MSVTNKQTGATVPVELFITTATASLPVKKDQQSLIFMLDTKKVKYECFDVASDDAKREEMHKRSGQRKLPQLFIDGKFIGGYEEVLALEEEGKLAEILNP
jgi:glutaredoxin 3